MINNLANLFGCSIAYILLLNRQAIRKPPKIYYVSNTGSFNARTLPPFGIFINEKERGNLYLLRHEEKHWEQYQRLGLLGYYLMFADQLNRHGYDNCPLEKEARYLEDPQVQENYTESIRTGKAKTAYNPHFRKKRGRK